MSALCCAAVIMELAKRVRVEDAFTMMHILVNLIIIQGCFIMMHGPVNLIKMGQSYFVYHKYIAKGMGIFLNSIKVLKLQVLLQLYYSFVSPYLIYCSEVWGTASDIHIKPLIKLHIKKNNNKFFPI